MQRWKLSWQSSVRERVDDATLDYVETLLDQAGVELTGCHGGVSFAVSADDPTGATQAYFVKSDDEKEVELLRRCIAAMVKHDVLLEKESW